VAIIVITQFFFISVKIFILNYYYKSNLFIKREFLKYYKVKISLTL
jgi:hypothetical protein